LREGVKRFSNVQVYLSREVVEVVQDDDQAVLKVENKQDGSLQTISSLYVVGCDGGRSMVRRSMEATLVDIGLRQQWLVIDIKLKQPVDLPKIGIQYCNPARPITYVPMIGDYDRFRWEMMLMPGEQKEEMERPERVWELLQPWVNPENAELERAAVYVFHSVIASHWRKGRILLAGDSAHQTPPFLGQGMCAGIRDAANVTWKLEMVINGKADESLLDTYQSERSPHVHAFIDLATELGKIITVTDPVKALERDRKLLEGPTQTLVQPAPSLGAGVHAGGGIGGTIFPQPRLKDGRLLDDVIGPRFAVIGSSSVIDHVAPETKQMWNALGAVVLTETDNEIAQVLKDLKAEVVLLRPDRYVLGAANRSSELDEVTLLLQQYLKSSSKSFSK